MITREEYIKALDVVEQYHKELSVNIQKAKTKIKDWDKLHLCSTRLRKALSVYPDAFVDDLDFDKVLKFRNIGKETAQEFINLKNETK